MTSRILCMGDLHLTNVRPVARVDNYVEAQWNKLEQIAKIYQKYGCDKLLIPGDLGEVRTPSWGNRLTGRFAKWIWDNGLDVIGICGQHDLFYHNPETFGSTTLSVLDKTGTLNIIPSGYSAPFGGGSITGVWWGGNIPKAKKLDDLINILLIHKSVGYRKEAGYQEPVQFAKEVRRKSYDIVVLGDWHYPFHYIDDSGVHLINAGSLMRSVADKENFERIPGVMLVSINGDEFEIEGIELDCAPANKVLSVAHLDSQLGETSLLSSDFMARLKASKQKVSFLGALALAAEEEFNDRELILLANILSEEGIDELSTHKEEGEGIAGESGKPKRRSRPGKGEGDDDPKPVRRGVPGNKPKRRKKAVRKEEEGEG